VLSCKRQFVFLSLAVLLSTLTACANSPTAKNLEQSLAADARLQNNSAVLGETKAKEGQTATNLAVVKLPVDFPKDIPIYPNSTLEEVIPTESAEQKVSTRWNSSDPSNLIASFYRSQFLSKNWQLLQQPTDDVNGSLTARRSDLLVTVFIKPKSVTQAAANQPQTSTKLQIDYVNSPPTTKPTPDSAQITQPGNPEFIGPVLPTVNQPNNTKSPDIDSSPEFSDINKVPPEWRQHLQELAKLNVLSIESKTNNQFEPGKIITRREYARWLVAANNAMYLNNPAKQIRLASTSNASVFRDISPSDPDFPAIQGLAEAGLVPSSLSGDTTSVLFRPDAPLTREQLLLWKVPLDTRQALPMANIETVKQTWGFQDAEKIDPHALRAVLADFQNAEQSNIRRIFGYTTLLQPKKPVNRAEAAAALWYFGTQGEGISATEGLLQMQTNADKRR
jgi:hypothetical protein